MLQNLTATQAFNGLEYVDGQGRAHSLTFTYEGNASNQTITTTIKIGKKKHVFVIPLKLAQAIAKNLTGMTYDVKRMTPFV